LAAWPAGAGIASDAVLDAEALDLLEADSQSECFELRSEVAHAISLARILQEME
jgi:hypothetical protein